jgi:hypothetical protein
MGLHDEYFTPQVQIPVNCHQSLLYFFVNSRNDDNNFFVLHV